MSGRRPRIVVTRQRPWLRCLTIGGAVLALVLVGGGVYHYTRAISASRYDAARGDLQRLQDDNRQMESRVRHLKSDNRKLLDQLTYARRSGQIDSQACTLIKKSLGGLQQENSSLREQLAFYRGIAAPKQSIEGLRVYDLKVSPQLPASDDYDFELLLIQPMHHERLVAGQAVLSVAGMQDGAARSYPGSKLVAGRHKSLLFSFKYFQELDGRLKLPKGFRPLRVTVTLKQNGKRPDIVESFDWSKIEQPREVK